MKHGEIVFDSNRVVKEINGYDGDRKNFEFIELSEYYQIVNTCQSLLHVIKQTHKMNTQTIEDLERTLKKLGV